MGVYDERLWAILERKAAEEDAGCRPERQIQNDYLAGVRYVSDKAVQRATRTAESFPLFTLHDETHICNVLRLMSDLLGDRAEALTRDEAAMLILAACCHDIGMSYSKKEMAELLADRPRLDRYLERHPEDYVKVYKEGLDSPALTDDVRRRYLRSIHHERAAELLNGIGWPWALNGNVDVEDLNAVCRSHGEGHAALLKLEPTPSIDLRLCAVLLRLADLLDFDTSRAPRAVYDYYGLDGLTDPESTVSRGAWQRHMASHGFDFAHLADRRYPYELPYAATSPSMQVEQGIRRYLGWVDEELLACAKLVYSFSERWRGLVLPGKVAPRIKARGYESGDYRLSLDQDRTLELLVGEELYSDPAVFVRELIQNAIDAVRTRERLDRNLPRGWKPQINIRTWMDGEGYHWFRIEDNGLGMTEEIIRNHLLKVGSSYYSSAAFEQEKLRCGAADYTPISRFGIGLLSCFMGDREHNRVELSTRHYQGGHALRLSMEGMSGYYFLTDKNEGHRGADMPGVTEAEQRPYRNEAGTAFAVRTNLYQSGAYRGFREIVDRYVLYPPVPIHYEGDEGAFDYPTERQFMDAVHAVQPSEDRAKAGVLEFSLTEEQKQTVLDEWPEFAGCEFPTVRLKCAALDRYSQSPNIAGAVLTAKISSRSPEFSMHLGNKDFRLVAKAKLSLALDSGTLMLQLSFRGLASDDCREIGRQLSVCRNVAKPSRFSSPVEEAIIRTLVDLQTGSNDSARAMQEQFHFSPVEWERRIQEVIQNCADRARVSPEFFYASLDYNKRTKEWTFPVFCLSQFDWYKRLFHSSSKKPYSLTAHNGIICGNAEFFYRRKESEYYDIKNTDFDLTPINLGTILILKDSCRPELSLARDGVRSLSPKLAWEFEIVRSYLANEGFRLKNIALISRNTPFLTLEECIKLIDKRQEQLHVKTKAGGFRIGELAGLLHKHRMIEVFGIHRLDGRVKSDGIIYDAFLFAYLQQHFALHIQFRPHYTAMYITEDKNNIDDERLYLFPPGFFLPLVNESSAILTKKSVYSRYCCNADHPLSRFLIENGAVLKARTPGLFREFLRSLTEDDAEKLIPTVNGLLERLRALPGGVVSVHADLKLTEADFC